MNIAKELISLRTKLETLEKAYLLTEAQDVTKEGDDSNEIHRNIRPADGPVDTSGDAVCVHCGKPVSRKVMAYSLKKFGDIYCFECQKNKRKEA